MGANFDYSQIIIIAAGIFCIVRGFMVLFTGNLAEREMAMLRDYSENGIKRYKMLSAVMNILGGLVVIAVSVIRILNLVDPNIYRIVVLVILAVMVVVYIAVRNSCKNVK